MRKMIKLILGVFACFVAISLTSCGDDGKNVVGTLTRVQENRKNISLKAYVEDPDKAITSGSIQVVLYDEDDARVTNSNCTSLPKKDEANSWASEEVSLTGLTEQTTYTAKLICTIGSKQKVLATTEVSTNENGNDAEHPIEIATVDDLSKIKNDYTAYYKLTEDLNFYDETTSSNGTWTPMFSASNSFIGTFDGNGHTIKNFTQTSNTTYYGFFGYLTSEATVKNVTFDNVIINATRYSDTYVGVLAGYVDKHAKVENVNVVNSTITLSIGPTYDKTLWLGGLIGYNDCASVTNCKVSSTVITASASKVCHVGGFIGHNASSTTSFVENCYANATINVNQTCKSSATLTTADELIQNVGGFVGKNAVNGIIKNCASSGLITGKYEVTAKIYDKVDSEDTSENPEKEFKIRASSNVSLGGFAGYNDGVITLSACSNSIDYTSYTAFKVCLGRFVGYNDADSKMTYVASFGENNNVSTVFYTEDKDLAVEGETAQGECEYPRILKFGFAGTTTQNAVDLICYMSNYDTYKMSSHATIIEDGYTTESYSAFGFGSYVMDIVTAWLGL